MKILRGLLPILVAVGFSSAALAADSSKPFADHACDRGDISRFDNNLSERDWEELADYVNAKRKVTLAEKSNNLSIAGDVRFDWRHTNEKGVREGNYGKIRGGKSQDSHGERIGRNDFDVEFNLYFDYVCGRTWAVAQLEFDNSAGAQYNDYKCDDYRGFHGSGFCCDVCLRKAYFGYNICTNDCYRWDIEIGRRHLYHVFDSEVQFLSQFDGILMRHSGSWNCYGDWYLNSGYFVVDERANHYGFVTEVGLLDICDSGFDAKYSFINWKKRGKNRCDEHNPKGEKFQISQLTGIYHLSPDMFCSCIPGKVYGAFLVNHAATSYNVNQYKVSNHDRYAWYIGARFGEVCKCGDWAVDVQYQYVQANSIPDSDVSGIGRGNWYDERLTYDGRGNTNYKGWRVEALYAVTDNLSIDVTLESSREAEKSTGGKHHYNQFELETIYAF